MNKIVITGPESTGKSSLAKYLSKIFKSPYTEEQARSILMELKRPYNFEDLSHIALAQVRAEDKYSCAEASFLFCDTDLITIKIWSDYRYGKTDPVIIELIEKRAYDLYLLCKPDIPWIDDPLRENPYDRELLFDLHMKELNYFGKTYEVIEGFGDQRNELAVDLVCGYFNP